MRLVSLFGLSLSCVAGFAACSETITLGSECPGQNGPCSQSQLDAAIERGTALPAATDAGKSPLDVTRPGVVDASPNPGDSGPQVARPGPEPALVLPLRNPSFELTDGSDEGAIAAISLVPGRASVMPWYTCQAFAGEGFVAMQARTKANAPASDAGIAEQVQPREGRAFVIAQAPIGINALVLPLIQQLEQPLQAGKRYAFTLDVRTSGDKPASLRVGGATENSCTQFEQLDESALLSNHEWESICFSFVPAAAYSHILLQANFEVISDTNLYLDNLQPVAGCGER